MTASLRDQQIGGLPRRSVLSTKSEEKTAMSAEAVTAFAQSVLPAIGSPFRMAALSHRLWIEIGSEAMRFACDRSQQSFRVQRAMLGCADPQDWFRMQMAFLIDAQERYNAEATRFLAMAGEAAVRAWTINAQSQRYDDVPL